MMIFIFLSCENNIDITDVYSSADGIVEYPCLTSSDDCLNSLNIKDGTFDFYSSFHIDSSNNDVIGAILTVHGNNRNADDYFDKMVSVVSSQGLSDHVIVIAPKFGTSYEQTIDTDWYWSTTSWKWGLQSYSSASGGKVSSFEVIDSLLEKLDTNLFPNLSDVLISGHSSGAAFVQMYSASKLNNLYGSLRLHFSVVNNQYFLHPDSTRLLSDGSLSILEDCEDYNQWPYGLESLSPYMELIGAEEAQNNFYSNKVDYFIAENDTDADGITSGCHYDVLGNNRYQKNVNFMHYMDTHYPNNMHDHSVIPGLGHTYNTYSSSIFIDYINVVF